MKKFKQYLVEVKGTEIQKAQRAIVRDHIKKNGIKPTSSNRHEFHIKFPLAGTIHDFELFFAPINMKVKESPESQSSRGSTYILTDENGNDLYWVNNLVGKDTKSGVLFANKALTPEQLNLAGTNYGIKGIISTASAVIKSRYEDDVADSLIYYMNRANTKSDVISLDNVPYEFNSKDLKNISKDFGEVLASIWGIKNLTYRTVYFPVKSNEKLVDFYGIRFDVKLPVSVKSGGGSKVAAQNIVDNIIKSKRPKNVAKLDINLNEKSLDIIEIANSNTMQNGFIKLHNYMNTPAIKSLQKITGIPANTMDSKNLKVWLNSFTVEELQTKLKPFFTATKSYLKPATWKKTDRLHFIIAPLGTDISNKLNSNKSILDSFNRLAQQVSVLQLNVDVFSKKMTFNHNYFKYAKFRFNWPGYVSGNKLGFEMIHKK